ncbi:MAG: Smr/MutS family protein [Oscillospiraceae bacterium]
MINNLIYIEEILNNIENITFEELDEIKKEKDSENFSKLLNASKSSFRETLHELTDKADPVRHVSSNGKLARPLEKGDIVFVNSLGKEGLVLKKPDGDRVMVQAGILKTTVSISDVSLGGAPKQEKPRGKVSQRGVTSNATRDISTELNLRGMDSVEAIMALDNFIDRAVMAKIPTICIVHGKGTGVLRAAVQKRLKAHKSVKEFRLGRYGEGEDGVTIATLK